MQPLALTVAQDALIETDAQAPSAQAPSALSLVEDDALMAMPLAEAKHLVAAEFERRYLVRVMDRAQGSISEGARQTGIDRTNFRRLLQRHGLR